MCNRIVSAVRRSLRLVVAALLVAGILSGTPDTAEANTYQAVRVYDAVWGDKVSGRWIMTRQPSFEAAGSFAWDMYDAEIWNLVWGPLVKLDWWTNRYYPGCQSKEEYTVADWHKISGTYQSVNGGPVGCSGTPNSVLVTLSCPGGGAVSGTNCVNAPACPTGEWRNPVTGLCGAYPKNMGPCDGCPTTDKGNPVNTATGNKYQVERLYRAEGEFPLELSVHYNRMAAALVPRWGVKWTGSYERHIGFGQGTSSWIVGVYRPDGKVHFFWGGSNPLTTHTDTVGRLTRLTDTAGALTGWRYVNERDETELYDLHGKLLSITDRAGRIQTLTYDTKLRLTRVADAAGRALAFQYDSNDRIRFMTDPAGGQYQFTYNANATLATVTFPDGGVRTYHYENAAFGGALTGITDERGVRYATYQYDSLGRVTLSEHAGGANRHAFAYDASGTTVTDPRGAVTRNTFTKINGIHKLVGAARAGGADHAATQLAATWDANGNVTSLVDHNGREKRYGYDLARNLRTSLTVGLGAGGAVLPETRTTATQWHPTWRLPVRIETYAGASASGTPLARTDLAYDARGNLVARTETDPATGLSRTTATTWTYGPTGLAQQRIVDGPRTDVADITTYDHDAQGNVVRVTNALGHVTQITAHDPHGRPLALVDANGLATQLAYDARGRLVSRNVGGEVTAYAYDAAGSLTRVTHADGTWVGYEYDGARRMTGIVDHLGNRIRYTLDAAGNRTREDVLDPSGVLARTRQQVFDSLSRLVREVGAEGQSTVHAYDAEGNRLSTTDPLGRQTVHGYDALDRLVQTTDPLGGRTQYGHDPQGRVTAVTDPRGVTTTYVLDAFGNRIEEHSPDRGLLRHQYDAAGNLTRTEDAAGRVTTHAHDALNRLIQTVHTGPGGSQTVNYVWDQGANGIGRLARIEEGDLVTAWTYDLHGRITRKAQTLGGLALALQYSWDGAGRLTAITYPSGRVVSQTWTQGQLAALALDGVVRVGGVQYEPFGPAWSWTGVGGRNVFREFDGDGRLTAQSLGPVARSLTWDAASNLTGIQEPGRNAAYGYDALDRLTGGTDGSSWSYGYDPNGNRLSDAEHGYAYAPGSNRLVARTGTSPRTYTLDATGNLIHDGIRAYGYDARNRMTSVDGGNTASYRYDALNLRVRKLTAAGAVRFLHDEQGRLVGEYDATGTAIREIVWFQNEPVTLATAAATYDIHADHLGTPRAITDANNRIVWRWEGEPFGATLPDEDPDGDGTRLTFNLRFPGQYWDAETGLHHNNFRTYDSATGRYLESDPIGLAGGINTYLYANANPLSYTDPLGLNPGVGCLAGAWAGPLGCGVGAGIGTAIMGGVALAAILSTPGDTTRPEQCTDKPCPPCKTVSGKIVPVGTIGYRPMDTPSRPQHGIVGPHFNIYEANQNPNNCQCFWQSVGAVPPSGLPAGAIPIEPFAN